jgi:hypothetical protein
MDGSALRGVYLRPLPDPLLPARHSSGARRRAGQLQGFLRDLHRAAAPILEPEGRCELLVVGRDDWRTLFRYPYGLPFVRTRGGQVSIVAAADHPPRVLRRFDDTLMRVTRAGGAVPGDIREFLDLLLGHEWGHAMANLSGLRTHLRWFDELMASYLFLAALRETGADQVLERFLAWAALEVDGPETEAGALGAFEYPRHRMPQPLILWYQGVFARKAAELLERRGWELPLTLREALPGGRHRGDATRALLEVEPTFKAWFATFAPAQESDDPTA